MHLEEYIESTRGDGRLRFDLNFYESKKFEKVTKQANVTIGNLMYFEVRARAPVARLNFFVHGCVVRGAEEGQIYPIVDKGCTDSYTKTTRYGDYTQSVSSRFSYFLGFHLAIH